VSEQREPLHRGTFPGRDSLPAREQREPKHRGTLADRDFGRLMQDFEQAQRNVESAEPDARFEILRRMGRDRRDGFAREIDRRILP
jgi:hypothetical protein